MLKMEMTNEEYLEYKRSLLKDAAAAEVDKVRRHAAAPDAKMLVCTCFASKKPFDGTYLEWVINEAENAMKNLYVLPGTDDKLFDVGTPPAWKECRVKNEEYLWMLARLPGTYDLTEAYILTGERKYAEKALDDVINFIDTCPIFPLENLDDRTYIKNAFSSGTTNPWRQLEAGLRMEFSMRAIYLRLLESDVMTPEAHAKLAKSCYEHGAQLSVISPILWPDGAHNHFLSEMTGLLVAACLFPEFDKSDEWLSQAVSGLELCAKAQITPCGAQIEGSPHYHNICVTTFLDALEIASIANVTFSEEFMDLLGRALEYSAWTLAPDGTNSSIGDSPRTVDGTPMIIEKLHSFGMDDTPLADAVMLTHSVCFTDAERESLTERAKNAKGGIKHYSDVGQVVGRTGFKANDSWFTMICFSPVFNGHAHMDPMSFELNLKGKPVVVDPSFYTYEEGDVRKQFKLADYHSCLICGERMPFNYVQRWLYSEEKYGRTVRTYEGDGFVGADAIHYNYEPNIHCRLVLLFGDDTFVVTDYLKNLTGDTVKLYFHMHDTDLKPTGAGYANDSLRVLLPAGCEYDAIPSQRSIEADVAVPSLRLTATDKSGAETSCYISVFTVNDTVSNPTAVLENGTMTVSLMRNNKKETFVWNCEELSNIS